MQILRASDLTLRSQFIPCVLLLAGLPFLPESPRWLIKKGRVEEAVQIIARIQAGGNEQDPLVVAEFQEIKTVLELERNALPGWKKYIYNGMWKRTFAGVSVQAVSTSTRTIIRTLELTKITVATAVSPPLRRYP